MNIKLIIEPELYSALVKLSKDDKIIQNVLEKTGTKDEFINALIAALICSVDREMKNLNGIKDLLKSNPHVQKIIQQNRQI